MRLSPQTKTLLREFAKAEHRFLSKEDIRQDVLFDHDAKEGTIRQLICDARKQIKTHKKYNIFRIETIHSKGYKLTKIRQPESHAPRTTSTQKVETGTRSYAFSEPPP